MLVNKKMLKRSASPDSFGGEFFSFTTSKSVCVKMHLFFGFITKYIALGGSNFYCQCGQLKPSKKKIKQKELYRSHPLVPWIQLLLTYGKQIFPHLCGCSLVLIAHLFPSVMHQHDKHNLHSSHGRKKHFIQRLQEMLSVSWGGNQGVYAAVCGHAFRMMTQGQVRPQRRQQRKQKRLRD